MKPIRFIDKAGYYGDLDLRGKNRNEDVGLIVKLKAGEVATLGDIKTNNTFNPQIFMGAGKIVINSIDNRGFGGDGMQVRQSHVHVKYANVEDVTPTRPYSVCIREGDESIRECLARNNEEVYDPDLLDWVTHPAYKGKQIIPACHVDAVAQLYAVKEDGFTLNPEGIITDIRMPNVRARVDNPKVQLVMGSENNDYSDIHIGTERLDIQSSYNMPFVFNTLRESRLGCDNAKVERGLCVKIEEVKPRPKSIPANQKRTRDNEIKGFASEFVIERCNAKTADSCAVDGPKKITKKKTTQRKAPKNTGNNMITTELLTSMGVSRGAAAQWTNPLNIAADTYGMNVPTILEDWLAQLVHESQGLTRFRENLNYTTPERLVKVWPSRFCMHEGTSKLYAHDYVRNPEKLANEVYSDRMGNGPPESGDGFRFSGASVAMLTGRAMFQAYADFSGNDVVNEPELFDDKYISADSAAWVFAVEMGLIDEAEADLIDVIAKRYNGGYTGLKERKRLTAIAREYFLSRGVNMNQAQQASKPKPEKISFIESLSSRTVSGAVKAIAGGAGTGVVAVVQMANNISEDGVAVIEKVSTKVDEATAVLDKGKEVIDKVGGAADAVSGYSLVINWVSWLPWLIVLGMAAWIVSSGFRARNARIEDHRTGKNPIGKKYV